MDDPADTSPQFNPSTSSDMPVSPSEHNTPVDVHQNGPDMAIPIEETPEIVPVPEVASVEPHTSSAPEPVAHPSWGKPKSSGGLVKNLGILIVFVALFIVGVWLSSFLRQFTPSQTAKVSTTPKPTPRCGRVAPMLART